MTPRANTVPGTLRLSGVALALVLVASAPAAAIGLQESYQLALQNDHQFKAAQAGLEAEQASVDKARADLLPLVTATWSENKLTNTSPSYTSCPDNTCEIDSTYQAVNLRQPLFNRPKWIAFDQARNRLSATEDSFSDERQKLGVRLTQTYFEAVIAEYQQQLMAAQLSSIEATLASAKRSFERGVGTRTDVDEAQAQWDRINADALASKQRLAVTRHQLAILIGRQVDDLSALAGANEFTAVVLGLPSLEAWTAKAEQENPELQSLRAQLEVARLEVRRGRAGHYPTLDLVLSTSKSAGDQPYAPGFSMDSQKVGLELNVPLYAGGGQQATVRYALAKLRQSEASYTSKRLALGLQVRREFQSVAEGVERIHALEQAVRSAEQALIANQKSAQAGLRSRLNVLNAEQVLVQARNNLVQAKLVYLLGIVRLHALTGTADAEAIGKVAGYFVR